MFAYILTGDLRRDEKELHDLALVKFADFCAGVVGAFNLKTNTFVASALKKML
jgi:hypothetical protein